MGLREEIFVTYFIPLKFVWIDLVGQGGEDVYLIIDTLTVQVKFFLNTYLFSR